MCSPNFAYIEAYHFGAREIPAWFARLETSLWIAAGVIIVAAILFAFIRYPSTRRAIGGSAILVAIGALAFAYFGNPFIPYCGPFQLHFPTNEATINSIISNDGVVSTAYFHTHPRDDYWSENPVDISHTLLRFVCLTQRCGEVLEISEDGKRLTIQQHSSGTLYSCQGSDEISISIRNPDVRDTINISEHIPEGCVVSRPQDPYWSSIFDP